MADHAEAMVDISRQLEGAMGGPRRELELQVKHVKELNRDIADQKKLVDSLRNAPLELLSEDYQAQVDEANAKLNSLVEKQASLSAGAKAAAHAENLRTEALQRQAVTAELNFKAEMRHQTTGEALERRRAALEEEGKKLRAQGALPAALQENTNQQKALEYERELFYRNEREKREDIERTAKLAADLTAAELRDAGEVEKKQIRLNALRREYDVIRKRTGNNLGNDSEANRNEQRALQNQIRIDQRSAQRQLSNALAGAGGGIGGQSGRVRPPRSRGRSERERLADRGAGFIQQAEEAARTGKSPDYVAKLTHAGVLDLKSVGAKLGAATSKVSKADAEASGSPLLKTNTILTEIRDNLQPKAVK